MRYPLIILFLICTVACNSLDTKDKEAAKSSAGASQQTSLSVEAMQQDLSVLWSAFRDLHPAYGLYTSADSLQQLYKATAGSINKPLTEDEFIAAIYPLLSALKCGHTQLQHSAHYNPSAAPRLPRLPFQVLVQHNRVWITGNQVKEMQTGDEILSINKVPAASIIQHGGDLYASDGNNQTFRELFLSEYDGFEDACNKYYHWSPPYSIELRDTKGVVRTISVDTVAALTPQATTVKESDNLANWSSSDQTDYLPLRFLKHSSTAWFSVHSYQYNDTLIFEKAFKEIKEHGISNLIIDLRHNTGGDIRIAARLLSYLSDIPFQMVGDLWARVADPGKSDYEQYFDSSITSSFSQSFQTTGIRKNGHYQIRFSPAFGNLLARSGLDPKYHYKGNLVVLIDGATFSSGAHTAAAIKQYCQRAVFIGRETAGGSEGCSGGTIQQLTLPRTGVVATFPLLRVVSVLSKPTFGHGIMPDHTVLYTPMDIVTKRDADLEVALNVLASGR